MAGNAAAGNLEGFVYMAMNAFAQASITFTSQNFGARRTDRVPRVLITCVICVAFVGAAMGISFFLFRNSLLQIYTADPQTIAYGALRMSYICVLYFLCGVMDVLAGAMRGIGYSLLPTIVSLLGACALRIVWIFTIFQAYRSLETLYLSYPITWTVTAAAHLTCFLLGWRKLKARQAA